MSPYKVDRAVKVSKVGSYANARGMSERLVPVGIPSGGYWSLGARLTSVTGTVDARGISPGELKPAILRGKTTISVVPVYDYTVDSDYITCTGFDRFLTNKINAEAI